MTAAVALLESPADGTQIDSRWNCISPAVHQQVYRLLEHDGVLICKQMTPFKANCESAIQAPVSNQKSFYLVSTIHKQCLSYSNGKHNICQYK